MSKTIFVPIESCLTIAGPLMDSLSAMEFLVKSENSLLQNCFTTTPQSRLFPYLVVINSNLELVLIIITEKLPETFDKNA